MEVDSEELATKLPAARVVFFRLCDAAARTAVDEAIRWAICAAICADMVFFET